MHKEHKCRPYQKPNAECVFHHSFTPSLLNKIVGLPKESDNSIAIVFISFYTEVQAP